MKTVSVKVVRHLLAYLTVQKWLVGDVPIKVNFVLKVNHPLARERQPAMPISTKEIARTRICIATITWKYKIDYNANKLNPTKKFGCILNVRTPQGRSVVRPYFS